MSIEMPTLNISEGKKSSEEELKDDINLNKNKNLNENGEELLSKDETLNNLSSEENIIYEQYKKNHGHDYAIMQVEAMRKINNLPPELKVVAEKYLKDQNGRDINPPTAALHQAEAIQEINNLEPGLLKEMALGYYNDGNGYGPTQALKHAIEDSQKINLLEAKDVENRLLDSSLASLDNNKKSISQKFREVRVKKMIKHLLEKGTIK